MRNGGDGGRGSAGGDAVNMGRALVQHAVLGPARAGLAEGGVFGAARGPAPPVHQVHVPRPAVPPAESWPALTARDVAGRVAEEGAAGAGGAIDEGRAQPVDQVHVARVTVVLARHLPRAGP